MGTKKTLAGAKHKIQDIRKEYYWEKIRQHGAQYPTFHWPSVELLLSFIHTYDIMYTHFAKRFAKYGLSPATFNTLMILSRGEGKAYKQNDLSKLLFVSRANITGLVDSLVRQGLVKREPDLNDRRVCLLEMTEKGEALLEQILPSHYEEIKQVVRSINAKDKRTITAGFAKMLSSVVTEEPKGRK